MTLKNLSQYLLILKIVLHGNLDEFNFKKDRVEVKGYFADVIKEEEVKELIIKFENNSGIIKGIPMCDIQVSELKEVMEIDLIAPFIVAKHWIPQMIKIGKQKY